MESAVERPRAAGAGLVTGVAGYLTSVHVHYALLPFEDPIPMLVGVTLPLALSLTLFVIAALLVVGALDGSELRIGGWCVLGAVATAITGILIAIVEMEQGGKFTNLSFVIGNIGTYGAIGGIVVGAYDARKREVSARLDQERDRAKNLSTRLSVLNRVLRHDIRTNVTIIKGHADHILHGEKDPDEAARVIIDQAERLHELAEQGRQVEKHLDGSRRRQPTDLATTLREILDRIESEYPRATIETDLSDHPVALASPMLDTALEQLIQNSLEHNDEEPWVAVTLRENDDVCLRIADDGPGIPAGEIDVLDRGKETAMQHTSGLGLWIAKWVIEASGGDIQIDSRDPRGTLVKICLPDTYP